MEIQLTTEHAETITMGSRVWKKWEAMWNGDTDEANDIIADGITIHLSAIPKEDPNAILNAGDVKKWVKSVRKNYKSIRYATRAGEFVDGNQQVVTAHWQADIVFAGLTDNPSDVAGATRRIVGIDILKFKDGKIYECWTMNNPARD